jgi:hypothetical protein
VKNVTISLDDPTASWLRRSAAEHGVSVSSYVGSLLRDQMQRDRRYELAMRQYFSLEPRPLSAPGQRYPTREELYDRPGLR